MKLEHLHRAIAKHAAESLYRFRRQEQHDGLDKAIKKFYHSNYADIELSSH